MGNIHEVLLFCLRYFANMDKSNAAIHCADVRFSPITFRLADLVSLHVGTGDLSVDRGSPDEVLIHEVLAAMGTYEEDKGR